MYLCVRLSESTCEEAALEAEAAVVVNNDESKAL